MMYDFSDPACPVKIRLCPDLIISMTGSCSVFIMFPREKIYSDPTLPPRPSCLNPDKPSTSGRGHTFRCMSSNARMR